MKKKTRGGLLKVVLSNELILLAIIFSLYINGHNFRCERSSHVVSMLEPEADAEKLVKLESSSNGTQT